MSLGFGTENLFLFADGTRRLTVVDASRWRAYNLDFAGLGAAISDACLDQLAEHVRDDAIRRVEDAKKEGRSPDGPAVDRAKEDAERSVRALARLLPMRREGLAKVDVSLAAAPTGALRPAVASMWLASGDAPAESFHSEDYEEAPIGPLDLKAMVESIDYHARFEGVRGEPHLFHANGEGLAGHAAVSLPNDYAVASLPHPLEPLPVLNDYVGPGGVGVDGLACNIADDATLSHEFHAAIPLSRAVELHHTLYLHLDLGEPEPGVMKSFGNKRIEAARKALEGAGFSQQGAFGAAERKGERMGAGCEIWTRGGEADAIHLYANSPGREAMGRLTIKPFLLAARCNGGFDPTQRAAMLAGVAAKM